MIFYIRMYYGTLSFYQTYLIPSMQLFIPKQIWIDKVSQQTTSIKKFEFLVVLDNESYLDHKIAKTIKKTFPSHLQSIFDLRIEFEDPYNSSQSGHDRQQWDMFYADKYLKTPLYAKYIAIIDTDVVFKTILLPQILFADHDKDLDIPLVLGQPQMKYKIDQFWNKVPNNTFKWFYKKEPFKCMTYFPFIMHSKNFKQLRDTVMEIYGVTNFIQILKLLGSDYHFAQFNIFCSFMRYYHRSEYKFILTKQWLKKSKKNKRDGNSNCHYDYDKQNQFWGVPMAMRLTYFMEKYNEKDPEWEPYLSFKPAIRATSHVKYIGKKPKQQAFYAMRFGYCFATHFSNNTLCDRNELLEILKNIRIGGNFVGFPLDLNCFTNLSEINPYLFEFDGRIADLYKKDMNVSMKNHYDDIDEFLLKYNHKWVGFNIVMTNASLL